MNLKISSYNIEKSYAMQDMACYTQVTVLSLLSIYYLGYACISKIGIIRELFPYSSKTDVGSTLMTLWFLITTLVSSFLHLESRFIYLVVSCFAYFGLDTILIINRKDWMYLPHHIVTLGLTTAVYKDVVSAENIIHILTYAELSNVFLSTWNIAKRNRYANDLFRVVTPFVAITYVPLRMIGLPIVALQSSNASNNVGISICLVALVVMSWIYSYKVVCITRNYMSLSNSTTQSTLLYKAFNVFRRPDCIFHVLKWHIVAVSLLHFRMGHLQNIVYYELIHTPVHLLYSMGFELKWLVNFSNCVKALLISQVSYIWVYTHMLLSMFVDESVSHGFFNDVCMAWTVLT